MKHSTLPLLVELGCEEIPARFLDDARDDFGRRLLSALEEARLLPPAADAAPLVLHPPPAHGLGSRGAREAAGCGGGAYRASRQGRTRPGREAHPGCRELCREECRPRCRPRSDNHAQGPVLGAEENPSRPGGGRFVAGDHPRCGQQSELSQEHVLGGQVRAAVRPAHPLDSGLAGGRANRPGRFPSRLPG